MAAKPKNPKYTFQDPELFEEVMYHYTFSQDDMEKRKLRKNGWDDIIKAYFGYLPANWAYLSKVTDPVIRTTILEKTSRMFAGKLRGQVSPREGNDAIKAKIMNALLDFQWDNAKVSGTMLEKVILSDIQTRIFGASFVLNYWNVQERDGKIYEGPDIKVLDNRDVFVDFQANHIKNANWVQIREWITYQDLENKKNPDGTPFYKNLDVLNERMRSDDTLPKPERRDNRYTSITKQIRSLEDRVGQDLYFPIQEIVTEFRKDRKIIFSPRHAVILFDGPNPLDSQEIPVSMLRYYPIGDDVYGESEVESVLPLYRAINATLCAFLDQMNLAMRPPIKVANNAAGVRLDTLIYGPNAVWLTGDNPNNVQEHQSGTAAITGFNTSYTALKSAFQVAMGDNSMGISSMNPLGKGDKTATEIRATTRQQLARDNYNQLYLEEFLKDIMEFWIKMNQQFLFTDPTKEQYIIRVVGKEILNELKNMELAQSEIPDEVITQTADLIDQTPGGLAPEEIEVISDVSKVPLNPVTDEQGNVVPKLDMSEDGSLARLFIEKEDLHGSFDYVPDVKSMAIGVSEEAINGRNQALYILLSPGVQQQLMNEGATINVKDLLISVLEDNGVKNASKLFQSGQVNGQGLNGLPGITPEQAGQGVPSGLANARGGQMPSGPSGVQGMADISALFNTAGQPNVSQSQGLPQV
jgi:hypothetical protein